MPKGTITLQTVTGILHSEGTNGSMSTIIPAATVKEQMRATRNRDRILGTSRKKFDRSTSFLVAPHWMLYDTMCARIALLRWIERPPKKMKLWTNVRAGVGSRRMNTHKKGTHITFSINEEIKPLWPRRYSRIEYEMLPQMGKTKLIPIQISKLRR